MPKLSPPERAAACLERFSDHCFAAIDRFEKLRDDWRDQGDKARELDLGEQQQEVHRQFERVSWMLAGLVEPLQEITWAIGDVQEALRAFNPRKS